MPGKPNVHCRRSMPIRFTRNRSGGHSRKRSYNTTCQRTSCVSAIQCAISTVGPVIPNHLHGNESYRPSYDNSRAGMGVHHVDYFQSEGGGLHVADLSIIEVALSKMGVHRLHDAADVAASLVTEDRTSVGHVVAFHER